jgi:hypothetical protein
MKFCSKMMPYNVNDKQVNSTQKCCKICSYGKVSTEKQI